MLDTNICIAAMRKSDGDLFDRLDKQKSKLCISTITLHELDHGAERAQRPDVERGRIFALTSLLEVLDFDADAANHSGQIHAALAKSGQVIGAYDMLIAGHARSLGLTVVTSNLKEFSRIEGLRCEDWLG
ncbi:MAG: type II toxin-antitoxin system VapC family toxin [Novosphingobium sp.]|nr:type II toxin-antitoxin system VapC family toxin [Novosphingobium sp.]